jgi:hypothetical protein
VAQTPLLTAAVQNLVPSVELLLVGFCEGCIIYFYGDGDDLVACGNRIDYLLILRPDDFPEDRMTVVKPGSRYMGDEELAAVGVGTGICHGKYAGFAVSQALGKLIFEAVTGTAGAGTCRIAALDHELRDHAMEREPVMEAALREIDEIQHGERCLVGKEGESDDVF